MWSPLNTFIFLSIVLDMVLCSYSSMNHVKILFVRTNAISERLQIFAQEIFTMHVRNLNFTAVLVDTSDIGSCNTMGNCSHILGMMQRNEADFCPHGTLPKLLGNAGVLAGPVVSEFSGIIASQPGQGIKSLVEILDVIKAFSEDFYLFSIVTLSLVLVMLGHQIQPSCSFKSYTINYVQRLQNHAWHIYGLVVDQARFCNVSNSKRIVWISVAFATFAVMHGLMMNLVSTDLIVEISPPRVNSIDDLSTPYFDSVNIHIYSESPEYAALRDAPINSSLNKVFRNKIECRAKSSVNESLDFPKTLALVRAGKVVHILNAESWNYVIKLMSCCYKPINSKDLILSKSFVSSTLLSIFSKSVESKLKKYIERRVMVLFESDLMIQELKQYAIQNFIELGIDYNWNAIKCDKNLIENEQKSLPQFHIITLYSTFTLCLAMFAISGVILALENLLKRRLFKPKSRLKTVVLLKPVEAKPKEAWI